MDAVLSFRGILAILAKHRVEFILVGGVAAIPSRLTARPEPNDAFVLMSTWRWHYYFTNTTAGCPATGLG